MRWPPLADSDLWGLRERMRVGDLVIVVGEGLDDGLPTTEALLRSLAEGLPADRRASCLQRIGKGQLAMAAAVIERHDAQVLTTAARRAWSLEGRRAERLPLYAALAALPCRGFVTTAFHPRLHDAVSADRAGALLLTPANRATMGDLDGRTGWVFHLLGCAALAWRCALTSTDLNRLRADAAWRSAVTQLAGGSLLFIGCGADVGPLRELLADLQAAHGRDRPAKHAWLGTCADDDERHELQGLGLQVLDFGAIPLIDALRFLGQAPSAAVPDGPPLPVVDLAHLRAEVRKRTDGLPWLSDLLGVGVSLAEVTVEVSVRASDTARPRRGAAVPEHLATRRLSLPEVLGLPARHHALVGEAGSGKSTLLRHLVQHLQERGGGEPVYLHCRRLLREGRAVGLAAAVGEEYGGLVLPAVAAARDQGTLVILLDGLDEAAAALGGDAVRTAVGALLGDHPGCRVLVASRPEAKAESLGVPLVRVLPVEEGDAVALLGKLGVKTPDPKAVIAELRADPARRSLAESPLLLTLLAAVLKDHGGLPSSRAEIYNSAVELLLDRRFAPDGCEAGKIKRPGLARELLEHICGRLHASERDPWLTIDLRDAFKSGDTATLSLNLKLEKTWSDLTAFLDAQALQVGLLVKGGRGDTWEAPHRTLREYLAARGMVAELRASGWPQAQPLGVARALKAANGNPERYAELFALMVGEAARVEEARSAIPLRWVVATGQVEVARRALRDAKGIEPGTATTLWALRRKDPHERDVDVRLLTSRLAELVERPSEAVALLAEWLKGATNSSERFWCLEALKNLSAGLGVSDPTLLEWCERVISGVFDDITAERREAALKEIDRWGWGTVPVGLHWVGSPEGVGYDNERPQHRVQVTEAFRLMTVPGTNRLYACFDPTRVEDADDRPVVDVDWYDAALFAAWVATLRPDLAGCRLPTETEWEIGARGGTATAYWWGDEEADLLRVGWISKNLPEGKRGPQPVGQRPPNAFGLRDVHGNVDEWCSDPWDGEAWRKRVAGGAASGIPLPPPAAAAAPSAGRVFRGGSWVVDPGSARAAFRDGVQATGRSDLQGFRLALAPRPRS